MPVLIGTSGWQYAHWKRVFYPAGMPQRVWLEHHSALFQTVEVNNAFYRLPERGVFEQWGCAPPPTTWSRSRRRGSCRTSTDSRSPRNPCNG